MQVPGIEPASLPRDMPSELPVRYASIRFIPARYVPFRSRVLTASRAGVGVSAFLERREPEFDGC